MYSKPVQEQRRFLSFLMGKLIFALVLTRFAFPTIETEFHFGLERLQYLFDNCNMHCTFTTTDNLPLTLLFLLHAIQHHHTSLAPPLVEV